MSEDLVFGVVEREPVRRPRRLRSLGEKRAIVEETLVPCASAPEVARRHGVNTNLLFKWRRLYLRGEFGMIGVAAGGAAAGLMPALPAVPASSAPVGTATGFVPVTLVEDRPAVAAAPAAVLSLTLPGGIALRLEGAVECGLAQGVVATLLGRGSRC